MDGSPFDRPSPSRITEMEVSRYVEEAMSQEIAYNMVMFSLRRSAVIIGLRSLKPDRFLTFLYRNLREAAGSQFSKSRPGIICVQLRNMTNAQLRDVAEEPGKTLKPTGVQLMTAKFFDSPDRSHIHTVAYLAPGEFASQQSYRSDADGLIRDTITSEDAQSYTFVNKANSQAENSKYRVF